MNNFPFFSVIMPIYNCEKFIDKTIECFDKQTFKDFELIIVDDGSSDNSESVIKELGRNRLYIKYFHKENGGICQSRNYGLSNCTGQYIIYCDHDDLVDELALEKLHSTAIDFSPDVIKYSYKNEVYKDNNLVKEYYIHSENRMVDGEKLRGFLNLFNNFSFTVWNGAYKSNRIKKYNISFDESVKFGMEDVLFNLELLKTNPKIQFISDCHYVHAIRYGQSTSRKFDINKLQSIRLSLSKELEYFSSPRSYEEKKMITNKYIRTFFSTISVDYSLISNKIVIEEILKFRSQMDFKFSILHLLKDIIKDPKFIFKYSLFKFKMYSTLTKALRGQ